jgi:hypothetical protein
MMPATISQRRRCGGVETGVTSMAGKILPATRVLWMTT